MQIHYFLAFCMIGLTLINLALHFFWHTSLIDLVGWKLMDQMYMSLQYYAFLLSVVVFVIAFRETRRYSQLVKNEYSDLELLNINWLWQFIFLVIPMILFWGAELIRIALGGRGQSNLTIAVFLFIALFNYFVSYKAFTQHTLFEVTEPERDRGHNDKTYNTPREVPDQNVCQQIQQAMQTQEYFLDQNLTLHSFARQVQIPARTISSCVNQHAGFNFNEWVNNFRVDKALALINDENMQHLSIEGIGAEAGFKSRSAMYTAFKKKTGRSPGQFREI
jgi:AraC-like DNA-binding protein